MRVLGPMGRKTKSAVLALSVLLVVLGGQAVRASNAPERPDSPKATFQQASVTVPGPEKALVVQAALSSNTRGWTHGSGATPAADQGIRPELVDAYTLAVALAPTECNLSLSLLAAIGQVESGNLAGQRIDRGTPRGARRARTRPRRLGVRRDPGHRRRALGRATGPGTAHSAPCSCCPPAGARPGWTRTATGSATPRTCTTLRARRWSTSATAAVTSAPARDSRRRSSPTTTRGTTCGSCSPGRPSSTPPT